jgi:hypothetical protein
MKKKSDEKPPCSIKSSPFPDELACPHCGVVIEIWSDETETSCKLCGAMVYNQSNLTH